ncbi:MAG: hypothetical protein ACRERU_01365 [Methylococcales bacterium]
MKHLIDLPCFLTSTLLFCSGADPATSRMLQINNIAESVIAAAEAQNRELTDAEKNKLKGLFDEFSTLESSTLASGGLAPEPLRMRSRGRKTEPAQPTNHTVPNLAGYTGSQHDSGYQPRTAPANQSRPFEGRDFSALFGAGPARDMGGFWSAGEYFHTVLDRLADSRLVVNSQLEGDGGSGGFAVPNQIAASVFNETLEA